MDSSIIIAFLTIAASIVANIPAFRLLRHQIKKEQANTSDMQVGTSIDLMHEMRVDIGDLKKEVVEIKAENEKLKKRLHRVEVENTWLRKGVGVLIHQLECYDIPPEFTLDSIPKMEE